MDGAGSSNGVVVVGVVGDENEVVTYLNKSGVEGFVCMLCEDDVRAAWVVVLLSLSLWSCRDPLWFFNSLVWYVL